jgi:hypothetical protein
LIRRLDMWLRWNMNRPIINSSSSCWFIAI